MKTKIMSFLCLFCIINGFTIDSKPKLNIHEMGFRGKVKSVRESTYEAIFKQGEITLGKPYFENEFNYEKLKVFNVEGYISSIYYFESEMGLNIKEMYKYDLNGNMIEITDYSIRENLTDQFNKIKGKSKSPMEQEKLYSIFIDTIMPRFYDSNYTSNLIFRSKQIIKYNSNNDITEKSLYIYDSISENRSRHLGTEKFDYDENGYLIKVYKKDDTEPELTRKIYKNVGLIQVEERTYEPGCSSKRQHFTLDYRKNIIEKHQKWLNFKSGDLMTYKYDEANNLIEEQQIKGKDKILEKKSYKYDDTGNLLEEKLINSDYKLGLVTSYEYEFDKNNNWIQKILFQDGKPKLIIVRTIEYYE